MFITGSFNGDSIVRSLNDPVMNIYIAAKHLSDLRHTHYPDADKERMTVEQIRGLSVRYNRGSGLSEDQVNLNPSYGDDLLENRRRVANALREGDRQ